MKTGRLAVLYNAQWIAGRVKIECRLLLVAFGPGDNSADFATRRVNVDVRTVIETVLAVAILIFCS